MIRWSIPGLAAVQERLKEIEPKLRRRAFRQAVRRGARVVLREVRARTPVGSREKIRTARAARMAIKLGRGTIGARASLIVRLRTYKRSGNLTAIIGPARTARVYHWHLIEQGSKPRRWKAEGGWLYVPALGKSIRRARHYTGVMPALKPLERGLRSGANEAADAIMETLRRAIDVL